MKKLAILLLSPVLAWLGMSAEARPLGKAEAEARFAVDAAKHQKERQGLHGLRSAPVPLGATAGINQVARWVGGTPSTNRALLFYAFTDPFLTIYLIDETGLVEAHEVHATPASIGEAGFALRQAMRVDQISSHRAPTLRGIARAPSPKQSPVSVEEAAANVAELILPATIGSRMKDYYALWVVGDGVFATIPFPLLPIGGERMLVDEVALAISPSLWDLEYGHLPWSMTRAHLRKAAGVKDDPASLYRDQWPPKGVLAVGDPKLPQSRWRTPALGGARQEADFLTRTFAATTFIGEAATKVAVQQAMPEHYAIHIAAHGIADPGNPLDGGLLMLSGSDEKSAFLTAREVQSMKLRAQLVVLSACQSGLGQTHAAGMIGLSRAFILAGSPRVLMSLWSVDDEATLYLMQRFYHYLLSDGDEAFPAEIRTPAMALKFAMLDARKTLGSPALWASFAVFGTIN